MAIQLTWADVASTVAEFHVREGAKPNRSLYLSLGNEFLAIVAEQTECYHKTWTNLDGGDLELSGNIVELPIDLIRVTRIEWDGADNQLEFKSESWFNENLPGWQEDTSTTPSYYTISGNRIMFEVEPVGSVIGKLTVRGTAYLPELSDDTSDPNPLACLPVGLQRSVSDYILAGLPFDPNIPIEAMRQARFAAKIQPVLDRLQTGIHTRQVKNFAY